MNLKDLLKIAKIKAIKFRPIDLEENTIGGGVYRMYNNTGEVIYVGRSNNLHRRLHQHISKTTNTAYFIDQVKKIEWTTEPDPVYQCLLEAIFIAFNRPKHNDEVKDAYKKFGEEYDPTRE